jgi:quercetin dioxygenase-like cupin family protein
MRAVLIVAATAGLLLAPGSAEATPGSGVSAVTVAQLTAAGTDYVLREIIIQPGGSTGWHFHDGRVYAQVRAGTLTRMFADCTSEQDPAGSVIVEAPGGDHVHIGRNLGATPVVLDVLYLDRAGTPLAEDAPAPACATGQAGTPSG